VSFFADKLILFELININISFKFVAMSFSDYQERLARSIRVLNLPEGYDKENILSNLKNAGTIEDIKLGTTEMIVTYASSNEKDLSKMYDGCPVDDYVIKLEDTENFEVNSGQKAEEAEVNTAAQTTNVQSEPERHEEVTQIHREQAPEVSSPLHKEEAPKAEEKHTAEPIAQVSREEVRPQPTPTEVPEQRIPERKPEVQAPVQEPVQQRSGDNVKDLLKDLQGANLPARTALPNSDLFNVVANRNYLLIFTLVWSLQLFLRSVF